MTIASPDSGALLGIDDTYQVRVVVEDFLERNDLEIAIFLAERTGGAGTTASPFTYTGFADADVAQDPDVSTDISIDLGTAAGDPLEGYTLPGDYVRVVVEKGRTTKGKIIYDRTANAAADPPITAMAVDGDSLVLESTNNKQSVFVWYGKVHHSSAKSTGPIFAAALVFDDSDDATSDVVLSKESISIDADRTISPATFLVSNGPAGRVFGTDQAVSGFSYIGVEDTTQTDGPDNTANTADDVFTAEGTYQDVGKSSVVKVSRVGTATLNSDHGVLGIGDTLFLDVTLGGASTVLSGRDDDYEKIVLDIFGKERLIYQRDVLETPRTGGVINYNLILSEGDFDDFSEARIYHDGAPELAPDATPAVLPDGVTDTLTFYIVDKAGNRSRLTTQTDENTGGATAITKLLFDAKKPALDSTNGDTILPVTVDTISDGSRNADAHRIKADEKQLTYKLANTLDSLVIAFDGANDKSIAIEQAGTAINGARALRAGNTYTVDFTQLGIKDAEAGKDTVWITEKDPPTGQTPWEVELETAKDEIGLKTGMHTIKFTGTDVAGNVGSTLTRGNVYIDVDNISFDRSFPFGEGDNESGLDTLEKKTAEVVFRLSEPADSVDIEYRGTGRGNQSETADSSRGYILVGGQLTNTNIQKFRIPGLVHNNEYILQVAARDKNGNWTESAPDTFWYDTTYAVPQAAKFKVDIADGQNGQGGKVDAGDGVTVNLTAESVIKDVNAVTFDQPATLTIKGGTGIDLAEDKSTGASDNGDGTISLNGEDWVVGKRTVVFRDTVGSESLTISIAADDDSTLVGEADSVTVIVPDNYNQIIVSAPDTVTQGQSFMVNVLLADKFANQRVEDSRFVAVSANQVGVQVPGDAIHISKGAGSFQANSSGWSGGDLTITVRDIVVGTFEKSDGAAVDAKAFGFGTATVHVRGPGATEPGEAPDAPDQVVAEDYRGASGDGDQGGFVLLTWDLSEDHDYLDKYRIYRQIMVTTVMDEETGSFVQLEEPTAALVSWGTIDPVPGANTMRVVVATIDNDATPFGVAAERSSGNAKQAFGVRAERIESLRADGADHVQEQGSGGSGFGRPRFAALTPEALAYQARGIAPLFKSVDHDVLRSAITESEAVKAIDNIPPGAIPYLKVLDTPGDAGGSIRVSWTLSPDDRMLTTSVGNAIGGSIYEVPGVKEYNVYRKIGDGEFELVGQAPAGQTSFDDATVFNGVRYTYQVRPADEDNETASEFEGTAMAIRNQVLDSNGNVVLGLFGSDNQVGFDDFFILADQFGMTAEDEGFEPAFDLSPNNKIDLNDFFTFADFFGRTVEGAGKALPISLAGLNSDARFYLDAGSELPRVGEEMAILVSLQDFVELQGYGLSVSYDPLDLTYVGARVENSILGTGEFADGHLVSSRDGLLSLVGYGDVATEGDLGLSLVFRSLREIEDSYIDIVDAGVRDGSYGLNALATPVSVRIQTRPEVYALRNNYPNPFNPETTLKYDLPEAGDVKLEVYNMLGQVVRTLVNEHKTAGRYAVQWDATNDHGQSMSSGIYFYRVQVGGEFTDVKKMHPASNGMDT